MTNKYYLLIALTIIQHAVYCQVITPDLQDSTHWNVVNRTMDPINDNGKKGVRLNEIPVNGLMILKGSNFSNGTVYFRPFNFKNEDVARRSHAVQYISMPDY